MSLAPRVIEHLTHTTHLALNSFSLWHWLSWILTFTAEEKWSCLFLLEWMRNLFAHQTGPVMCVSTVFIFISPILLGYQFGSIKEVYVYLKKMTKQNAMLFLCTKWNKMNWKKQNSVKLASCQLHKFHVLRSCYFTHKLVCDRWMYSTYLHAQRKRKREQADKFKKRTCRQTGTKKQTLPDWLIFNQNCKWGTFRSI